jgi:hypothetical protein
MYKETCTPMDFSEAVYTALRVDGSGVIGHTPDTLQRSQLHWININSDMRHFP